MTFTRSPVPVVVDASAAIAFLVEEDDELTRAWESWAGGRRMILAPQSFWGEVANVLLRGKGFPAGVASELLDVLITTGVETTDRGLDGVRGALSLGDKHALTVYDAAYLWLAIDTDAELATKDRALIRAAEAEDVPLAI